MNFIGFIRRVGVLCVLTIALGACGNIEATDKATYPARDVGSKPTQNLDQACVGDYNPEVDYFPEKTEFKHSAQLAVTYGKSWKRVKFTPTAASGDRMEFLLVQCGAPISTHDDGTTIVVQVPIARIVTGNRSMLGAADELGIVERLVGMDNPRAATVPSVKSRVEQGHIVFAGGWTHGNIESTIALQPDVYLTFYSSYPQYNTHPRLLKLGVKALPQADRMETSPLGRAEWVKFLALLTNRESRANEIFNEVEARYLELKALVQTASERPTVMAGYAATRSVFETFGGRNQRAQLIADAGGRYALDDSTFVGSWWITGFERVYVRGAEAPVWIGAPPGMANTDAFLKSNPLHGWFKAVRERRVHVLDVGYKGAWAHHYEDQSMTKPHLLLAETIAVLHPELAARAASQTGNFFLRTLQ
jgi:iron complex transport system substrate-binding protein